MKPSETIDRLILFEAVRKDETCASLSALLNNALLPNNTEGDATIVSDPGIFYSVQRALAGNIGKTGFSGTYLQGHIAGIIAKEDNVFARMAERGAFDFSQNAGPDDESLLVLKLAAREIGLLSALYKFDFKNVFPNLDEYSVANIAGTEAQNAKLPAPQPLELIHEAMMKGASASGDLTEAAMLLASYYRKYGCGIFGESQAFSAEEYGLAPADRTDPITMDDLVGCERQKAALIENIEIMLAGYRANNMLLYGDSGTGKSSSVKALLNYFAGRGVKLISVAKDKLTLLPDVFEQIADRGMKFIIFIDDLSFEDNEYEFKAFKSIIEGRIAPRPENAVFIVTTNRKNIVRDSWADREGQDDVHRRDNMEEKRSLSDRFGITLTYAAPDKNEYLKIVRSLADKAGLMTPADELASEAMKWEIRHGGRSGRTARQFVDYMAGAEAVGGAAGGKE